MNFKDFLEKKSYTQEEFANKINVTRASVSTWANNRGKPSKMMQRKMAKVLNMDIEEVTAMFINQSPKTLNIQPTKKAKVEPKEAPKNDISNGLTDWDNI